MSIDIKILKKEYPKLFELKKQCQEEKIKEIIRVGYNILFPVYEENTENNIIISKLNEIEKNNVNVSNLNESITRLLGITNNSSMKGELGENIIGEYIRSRYEFNEYIVSRSVAHSGDGILNLLDRKVLIEVKSYSTSVLRKEIEKMRYDMEYNDIRYGILISLGSKIVNSNELDIEVFENRCIIKVSNVSSDYSRLKIGFDLIELLIKNERDNLKLLLDERFRSNLEEFMRKFNENILLRKEYEEMELGIKSSLDLFYQKLVRLQIEQENLLNNLLVGVKDIMRVNTVRGDLKEFSDYKIYPQLLRLLENEGEINIEKNKIYLKNKILSIKKDKIVINIIEPEITLYLKCKENDITWRILEEIKSE